MDLATIEGALYDRLGYRTTPDSSVTRRLRRFVNTTHREILGMIGMAKLRRKVLPFTSVANSPFATLPQAATSIITIQDRTNRRVLDEITLQDLRFRDPGLSFQSGVPYGYVIMNLSSPVAVDPSAAATLFVISDSAADDVTWTAYVEGTLTGGYYQSSSKTLNGVTAAQIGALATWELLTKFYLSKAAIGNVSLHTGSGVGPELARIKPGQTKGRYTIIELVETPSAALTYYADVELHVEDMSIGTDSSYLPEDYDWLLECGALMKEYLRREKQIQYAVESARWTKGIAGLRGFCNKNTGVALRQRRKEGVGYSQLGPYFPAGS